MKRVSASLFAALAIIILACGTALAGTAPKCPVDKDGSTGEYYDLIFVDSNDRRCQWRCLFAHTGDSGHYNFIHTAAADIACNDSWTCMYCDRVIHGTKHSFARDTARDVAPTCTQQGVTAYSCSCSGCTATDDRTIPALGHDESGAAATCTADKVCARAGCGAVLQQALGHDASGAAATCTTDQVCARAGCGAVLQKALGHDASGAAATCTMDQVCARAGCGAVLQKALGHDYKASVTRPSCTKDGYTTYTCSRCNDSYRANVSPKTGHWYGEWSPNMDGKHIARCKRGCSHTATVSCASIRVALSEGSGDEYTLAFCPICGAADVGEPLVSVEGAKAEAVTGTLPQGKLILRRGVLSNGAEFLSVAFERAGKLTQPTGLVKILLPAEEFEGYAFSVLPVSANATSLSSATEEIDGKKYVVLELDFGAEESGDASPAMLIALTPAA